MPSSEPEAKCTPWRFSSIRTYPSLTSPFKLPPSSAVSGSSYCNLRTEALDDDDLAHVTDQQSRRSSNSPSASGLQPPGSIWWGPLAAGWDLFDLPAFKNVAHLGSSSVFPAA